MVARRKIQTHLLVKSARSASPLVASPSSFLKVNLFFARNTIKMMTPAMAALCEGEIKKRWISHREEAVKKKALEIPENRLPLSVVQGSPSGLRPPVNP